MDFVFEKIEPYGNAVLDKSFEFAVRIVKFYSFINNKNRNLNPLYKQLLKSGTSIGANVSEAQYAQSKNDFINKLHIALKETFETEYWLKLLKSSEQINEQEFKSLHSDCKELIKILISIIKSAKINKN